MALTLLSFFTLAIAGFGVCQASTRRLELPTNALINFGLGFFVVMAAFIANIVNLFSINALRL